MAIYVMDARHTPPRYHLRSNPALTGYPANLLDHKLAVDGVDVVGADNTLTRAQAENRISLFRGVDQLPACYGVQPEKVIQTETAVGGVEDSPQGLLDAGPVVFDVVTTTCPASPHSASGGGRAAPTRVTGRR